MQPRASCARPERRMSARGARDALRRAARAVRSRPAALRATLAAALLLALLCVPGGAPRAHVGSAGGAAG
jgi:hypothetical protein